jgi:hypothetical protein
MVYGESMLIEAYWPLRLDQAERAFRLSIRYY